MSPAVGQRLLLLVGVALAAGVVALAVTRERSDSNASALPEAAPAPGGGWYRARAAAVKAPRKRRTTDCSVAITAKTIGVSHPVLPCRVQLYIEFEGRRVLTRVIGRSPRRGTEFGLTEALADELGVHGAQQIRWRFAVAPS